MDRRQFVAGSLAASLMTSSALARAPKVGRKPNIIVVMCDDLGFGDLGCYGSRLIRTPQLDRMARNGTRFTNFYASANICSQSRAGFLTGRFAVRSGLANEVIQANDTHGLPVKEITIAEMLKPEYRSALIGKWHLGHVEPYWPPRIQGFDYFYGVPYSNNMLPLSIYESGSGEALTNLPVDYHRLTAQFFERGLRFIEENRDHPFFLNLSLTAPHAPTDPNPDLPRTSRAGDFGDVVEEIDFNMGRLLARLRTLGLEQDTLILFTSDNGPWFEGSSGDARDRKGGAGWDGGYKVPLIAYQPGRVPARRVVGGLAMNTDLLPTLASWTGAALPDRELDGRDIGRMITTGGPSPHQELYLFNNREITGIRTARWKLVKQSYYRGYKLDLGKYMISRQGALLFDMEQDPGEQYSVASRHPDVFAHLMQRLAQAQAKYDQLAPG